MLLACHGFLKSISKYNILLFHFAAVTEAGKSGDPLAQDFFREEYVMNNTIGNRHLLMNILKVLLH